MLSPAHPIALRLVGDPFSGSFLYLVSCLGRMFLLFLESPHHLSYLALLAIFAATPSSGYVPAVVNFPDSTAASDDFFSVLGPLVIPRDLFPLIFFSGLGFFFTIYVLALWFRSLSGRCTYLLPNM